MRSLSTETEVGERQPMSRMRGLPSAGSGSVCSGVKPRTLPAPSWRIRVTTTRSTLRPRTTATRRLPSRETSSSVTLRPVSPGTVTVARDAVDDQDHPGAARAAVEDPGPVAVVPAGGGQVDGTGDHAGGLPVRSLGGREEQLGPGAGHRRDPRPVEGQPIDRMPRSSWPSGPRVSWKAPIAPLTTRPRLSANSSLVAPAPLGS